MPGTSPSNSTSTTGPMTWTILPLLTALPPGAFPVIGSFIFPCLTERHLAADDFEQFLGDIALAQLVVFERQVLDEILGVIGGVFHGDHAGALFAGLGIQQHLIEVDVQVVA